MSAVFLPLILILGAVLRLYNNIALALWHDEAFSALYLRYPLGEMMARIILDVHPPLYYLILRLWSSVSGDSLLSLRLLSIIFGVLTVWAGYLFIKAAFHNKHAALLSALILAINPFQIQYALEARMYTLGTFLILLSSYFLIRALESNRTKYWLFYSVTAAACLYTHYYLFFSVAAQGLFVLLYLIKNRNLKTFINSAWSYAGTALLFLPWLPYFNEQRSRVQAAYWIPAMDRWSIPGTVWKMIFGGTGIRNTILVIASVIAILIIIYFIRKISSFNKWLVFLSVAVPFAGAILLSVQTNIYLDRYFVFASLFFTMIVTMAVLHVPKIFWRASAMAALIVSLLFAFLKNWQDLGVENKPGMAAASQIMNKGAKPGDKLYVGSSFIYFTFKYYNRTDINPLLISDRPLKDIPHFSGTAILEDRDLILDYQKTPKNSTVWLLWTTGFGGSKPVIPKNWKLVSESKFADTPGFKGDIIASEYKIN